MPNPIITIDGPSGSGKTTVGRTVANRLGLPLIDTGLIYRAVAYECLRASGDPGQGPAATQYAASLQVTLGNGPRPTLRINGRRLVHGLPSTSAHLYLDQVERAVPLIARQESVRAALLPKQRGLLGGGAVLLGRDAGTTVCPEAGLKVYLDADAAVRAQRLRSARRAGGQHMPLARLQTEIDRRDDFDSNRASSPLRVPSGALQLDTDQLPARAVSRAILRAWKNCQASDNWPLGNALLMDAVTEFFDVYLRLYCDPIRIEGAANVPSRGPVIITPRHVHNADVNFLAHHAPRHLRFLAKDALFERPLIGWAVGALRAIPTRRDGGDTGGLRRALAALVDGEAVCVFPEGRRSRNTRLQPPHPGAGFLALRSGAMVVPAAVLGMERLDLSKLACPDPVPTVLRFGKPFRLRRPPGLTGSQAASWASWKIMREIAALLPPGASADISGRFPAEGELQ